MRKFRPILSLCALLAMALACAGCAGTALSGPGPAGGTFAGPAEPGPLKKLTASMVSAIDGAGQSLKSLGKSPASQPADPIALDAKAEPPDAPFYVALARLREQANHQPAAIDMYQRALRLDPTYLPAQLGLARLYDRQGQLQKACEFYQQAAKDHPHEPTVYNDLGLCLARQGRLPEAASSLARAVALRPQHALYRNNLASVLVEQGRIDEAYAQLAAVHGRAVAHYNLGYMLQRRGSRDLAVQQFELALAADPNLHAAHQWLAALEGEVGAAQLARAPQDTHRHALAAPVQAPPRTQRATYHHDQTPGVPAAPTPDAYHHDLFDSDWPPAEPDGDDAPPYGGALQRY